MKIGISKHSIHAKLLLTPGANGSFKIKDAATTFLQEYIFTGYWQEISMLLKR